MDSEKTPDTLEGLVDPQFRLLSVGISSPRYLDVFGQDPEQDKDDPEISTMFARPFEQGAHRT